LDGWRVQIDGMRRTVDADLRDPAVDRFAIHIGQRRPFEGEGDLGARQVRVANAVAVGTGEIPAARPVSAKAQSQIEVVVDARPD
jgi:hypothetical protein